MPRLRKAWIAKSLERLCGSRFGSYVPQLSSFVRLPYNSPDWTTPQALGRLVAAVNQTIGGGFKRGTRACSTCSAASGSSGWLSGTWRQGTPQGRAAGETCRCCVRGESVKGSVVWAEGGEEQGSFCIDDSSVSDGMLVPVEICSVARKHRPFDIFEGPAHGRYARERNQNRYNSECESRQAPRYHRGY